MASNGMDRVPMAPPLCHRAGHRAPRSLSLPLNVHEPFGRRPRHSPTAQQQLQPWNTPRRRTSSRNVFEPKPARSNLPTSPGLNHSRTQQTTQDGDRRPIRLGAVSSPTQLSIQPNQTNPHQHILTPTPRGNQQRPPPAAQPQANRRAPDQHHLPGTRPHRRPAVVRRPAAHRAAVQADGARLPAV